MPRVSSGATFGGKTAGGVKVYGVPETISKLKLVGSQAGLQIGNLVYRSALVMLHQAQEGVPVETGNLKSGIQGPIKAGKYDWIVTAASLDGNDPGGKNKNQKEYSHFVEFGTSKMVGRFYMTAAAFDAEAFIRLNLPIIAARLERL